MIKQRTIKEAVTIEGVGLQTGAKVTMKLKSSPANSGINFIRTDLPNKPLLNLQSLNLNDLGGSVPGRRTTLAMGPLQIQTTEHFLAALSGLGIDNIVAELDGTELPGLDGSAKEYVEAVEKAGIVEQDALVNQLAVGSALWCAHDDAFLAAFPHDGFRISYFLSYPIQSVGKQFLSLDITESMFKDAIAPARTFCMKKEALFLRAAGFGKGAGWENTLVMAKNGPVNNKLRFPDEHVRHKILDLIGDLCLVGKRLRAHIVAIKSGHKLNMELVKKLKEA